MELDTTGTIAAITARLQAMHGRRHDPEIAAAALRVLARKPYTSLGARPMWAELFALVVQHGEPSHAAALKKQRGSFPKSMSQWVDHLIDTVAAAITRTGKTRVTDAEVAGLDGLPMTQVAGRMLPLLERAPDGRIASLATGLFQDPPVNLTLENPAWFRLAVAVSIHGDASDADALPDEEFLGWVRLALKSRRAKPRATTKKAAAADDLLARIYEAPDDDARRLVHADALSAKGDPRGELIALQIAGRDEPRQRALIRKHGKAWMGPFAKLPIGPSARFTRGFLSAFDAAPRTRAAWAIGDPAWATIEEVGVGFCDPEAACDALLHPAARSLRALAGLSWEALRRVVAAPPPRLEHLGGTIPVLDDEGIDPAVIAAFRETIPTLRRAHLAVDFPWCEPAGYAPLWKTKLLSTVTWFATDRHYPRGWFPELARLPRRLATFAIFPHGSGIWGPTPAENAFRYVFTRDGKGWALDVTHVPGGRWTVPVASLYDTYVLQEVAPIRRRLQRVRVIIPPTVPSPPVKALERAGLSVVQGV